MECAGLDKKSSFGFFSFRWVRFAFLLGAWMGERGGGEGGMSGWGGNDERTLRFDICIVKNLLGYEGGGRERGICLIFMDRAGCWGDRKAARVLICEDRDVERVGLLA
jgi:hypothetical protein